MARRVGLAQLAELARLGPPPVSTYSIVACDRDSRQWGVATQSKFLAVGSVVPWAEAEVGAIATQSYANPRYGPDGLALLRQGLDAEEVVRRLIEADDGRDSRQLGVVDASGGAATFTGGECQDWAGGRTGDGYAAQGNILVDLRVDDHEHPIDELRRLYRLHDDLFGQTPRALWVDVDEPLQTELMERLTQLGHSGTFEEALNAWAGTENYEMRVDGVEQIDPVVLEALRGQT